MTQRSGFCGVQMFVERAISGVETQQIAFAGNPLAAVDAGRAGFEYKIESAAFQRGHLLVFDDRRGPQRDDRGAVFPRLRSCCRMRS